MKKMRVISSPTKMQRLARAWERRGISVGFVPTMGALHAGHLSLVRRARAENKIVVASVYVNPAQFGPAEDFSRYPRPFARDAALCRKAGVDVLFRPRALYAPDHDTWVTVEKTSAPLCGRFRPGHFRGVATVVLKLFNLVRPARAYFGLKDYQQVQVVRRMARDLDVPVKVVAVPTAREADGLALSSRNAYLSPAERAAAARIPAALRSAAQVIRSARRISVGDARRAARAELSKIPGARVQYVDVADPDTLGPPRGRRALVALAVVVGKTRLIDNAVVTHA